MNNDIHAKKEILKDIILRLHQGLSVEEAKARFEKEIGSVTSAEIAELEEALINEGMSPEEIKKFCNVHALLFQSALEKSASEELFPSHPVYLFKLENREVEKLVRFLKDLIEKRGQIELSQFKESVKNTLEKLTSLDTHYKRKEQVLFPYLEKQGFMGPSKVMWGKDDEVRGLLKEAARGIKMLNSLEESRVYVKKTLNPLIEEILGMVFKEENILFPTALEKLNAGEWVEILKEGEEIGYVFIKKPKEAEVLMKDLKRTFIEEPLSQGNRVSLPTGSLDMNELMCILNTLAADITFVDKEDRVRYFSESKDRIFVRTKSVIGRKVQNCHPPQSVDVVEKILASFKERKKDFFEFWIHLNEKLIYIRYFALRDRDGEYLGTLEVTQDITEIRKLEGEKRLYEV